MINQLTTELAASAVDALRKNPSVRTKLVWGSLLIFVGALILYLGRFYWVEPLVIVARDIMPPVLLASGTALLLALISYTRLQFAGRELELELDTLRGARHEIIARLAHSREAEAKPDDTVRDTIQLSLNQITEYYTINKSQARSSFRFSVFAMVAGLATIIVGLWLAYFRETPNMQIGLITGASGVLIQFISGSYFWMHQKSLSQLNYFYDKLVRMQDTMLAIQLSETLPEAEQHETTKKLIASLMERSSISVEPPKHKSIKRANKTAHPTAGNVLL